MQVKQIEVTKVTLELRPDECAFLGQICHDAMDYVGAERGKELEGIHVESLASLFDLASACAGVMARMTGNAQAKWARDVMDLSTNVIVIPDKFAVPSLA